MPRTSRQHSDTGVYHVMLRGIDRQDIFADDQDRGKLHQKNRPYFHLVKLDIPRDHVVKKGESLVSIARQYSITAKKIIIDNEIRKKIKVGDHLIIKMK